MGSMLQIQVIAKEDVVVDGAGVCARAAVGEDGAGTHKGTQALSNPCVHALLRKLQLNRMPIHL